MTRRALLPAALALLLPIAGCTSFRVQQTDSSPNERTISTTISGTAWFSSAQNIAKLKALQTDKTQSFGSDSFSQHGATNTAETVNALARLLEALKR